MGLNNLPVVFVLGLFCYASGEPVERSWSGKVDWPGLLRGRLGGSVRYNRDFNFNFHGSGFIDRGGNWGVKAGLTWRFKRDVERPQDLFYLRVEVDPCQFAVYDKDADGEISREEMMAVYPDRLADKLFDELNVDKEDDLVTREEFDFMAPQIIAQCASADLLNMAKGKQDGDE